VIGAFAESNRGGLPTRVSALTILATNASDRAASSDHLTRVLTVTLGLVVLARFATLGLYPLFDNTEARYALIGLIMHRSGDWVTPFVEQGVPFWGKPPLSFWATAASYSIFGVNEFAARFSPFVFSLATAALVFVIARTRGDRAFALLATTIFTTCGLTLYLAGGVMTDPALMFTVAFVMVTFWKAISEGAKGWGYAFFIAVALTLLAKGPVGIVISGLAIGAWVAWNGKWQATWRKLPWLSGTLLTLLLAGPWYVLAESHTPGFLRYFIIGEHFDRFLIKDWHGDKYGAPRTHVFGMIWLFLIAATAPWCITVIGYALAPVTRRRLAEPGWISREWLTYIVFWLIATPVFFTAAHAVLVPYVALCLPAFALLAAEVVRQIRLSPRFIVLTAGIAPAMLVAAAIFLVTAPTSGRISTQKYLVAAFKKEAPTPDARLVYYPSVPFSAEFYMPGRSTHGRLPEELEQLAMTGNDLFAMTELWFSRLPVSVQSRFDKITELNGTLLLRPRSKLVKEGL
jgi:4-amino-4-deoxy-L-arabinose transferase-like glycosyltransferase